MTDSIGVFLWAWKDEMLPEESIPSAQVTSWTSKKYHPNSPWDHLQPGSATAESVSGAAPFPTVFSQALPLGNQGPSLFCNLKRPVSQMRKQSKVTAQVTQLMNPEPQLQEHCSSCSTRVSLLMLLFPSTLSSAAQKHSSQYWGRSGWTGLVNTWKKPSPNSWGELPAISFWIS